MTETQKNAYEAGYRTGHTDADLEFEQGHRQAPTFPSAAIGHQPSRSEMIWYNRGLKDGSADSWAGSQAAYRARTGA